MKRVSTILLSAVLVYTPAVFAENASESHTESTDAAGTTVKTDTSHESSKNILGTNTQKSELERVTDPKGLGNKTTEKLEVERKVESDGDVTEKVQGVDAAGTGFKETDTQKTKKNWGGGTTTTSTHQEVTDPKGLGNKTKVETTKEVTRDEDGTSVTTKKKVNGDTVAEHTEKH